MNSDSSIKVDFKHFLKLAKANIMSWDSLSNLLNETTSTLHLSKELNQILLQELKRSEADLLKHLAKEKEVERTASNSIVESKSIGIQTEDQNKEKTPLEDERMEDFHVDKPTKVKDQIISLDNVERSFEIKPENASENDILLTYKVIKEEDSPWTSKYANEFCFDDTKDSNVGDTDQSQHNTEKHIQENEFESSEGEKKYKSEAKKFDEESNVMKTEEKSNKTQHPYKCKDCGKLFTLGYNLKRHKRIHANERPYQCTTCLKCFRRKSHLIKHNKTIHQIYDNFMAGNEMKSAIVKKQKIQKSFDCQTCYKRFDKPSKLKVHETIHTGEKPYKCKVCERCFRLRYDLQKHLRRHGGERPYRCDTCLKGFIEAYELKDHQRTHEKPFDCKSCCKKFSRPKALRLHMKVHNEKTETA